MSEAEIFVTLGGLGAIAFLAWFFFGPKQAQVAGMRGDVQEVQITVKGGYSPDIIRVRKGVPLRLSFDRQEAGDCTSRVVFPDFGASKTLAAFARTTLEFTPDRAGQFGFACGMNMLHGTLIVEDGEGGGKPGPAPGPAPQHGPPHEPAVAVGVGPTMQVEKARQVEFAIVGGGVSCPSCVANIEAALKDQPGVDEVHVSFGAERITVQYDSNQVEPDQLRQLVEAQGYTVHQRDEPGSPE
ncbi:MAG: cupredoxin domain-containing protein, partial [Candidatus Methylomirabilia bacterium]